MKKIVAVFMWTLMLSVSTLAEQAEVGEQAVVDGCGEHISAPPVVSVDGAVIGDGDEESPVEGSNAQ